MQQVVIVGAGFVADLYMRSFALHPEIEVAGVHDLDAERLRAFCAHWGRRAFPTLEALFDAAPRDALVLNLTNPDAHFEISRAALEAGFDVYSEKPLATTMEDAFALRDLAGRRGRQLGSAPCSVLGETAQIAWMALREGAIGAPRLVYAELDDGYVPQAPYRSWRSDSGASWPWRDEFRTGCTLEHAGYYLTWLMAMFGTVRTVIAASADLVPEKMDEPGAPDFSCAVLFFETGVVARLTNSIVAPHDHRLRIVGDRGEIEVDEAWSNAAPVRVRRRFAVRRRLVISPVARRVRIAGEGHPKIGRWGAAAMNFALGPAEMLAARREGRPCRLSTEFALHLNEVTLAIQDAGDSAGAQRMRTACPPVEPMPWAIPRGRRAA